ncbi:RHS repeat domain-containing protein [Streptomyces sp. NPDC002156]
MGDRPYEETRPIPIVDAQMSRKPPDERPKVPPPPDPEPPEHDPSNEGTDSSGEGDDNWDGWDAGEDADSGQDYTDDEEDDSEGSDEEEADEGGDEEGYDQEGGAKDNPRAEEALDRMEEAAERGGQATETAAAAAADATRAGTAADQGRAAAQLALAAGAQARAGAAALNALPATQLAGVPASGLWRTGVGDPVDPLTGAWWYDHVDTVVETSTPLLAIQRNYCSQLYRVGCFGPGWETWLDTTVRVLATGAVYLSGGDGSGGFFGAPAAPGDPYVPPEDLDNVWLRRTGAGWLLATDDGWLRTLDATGQLVRIAEPGGTGIDVRRTADGRIESLVHDDGPRLVANTNAVGLISGITDPLGRRWSYTYDSAGRLRTASDPSGRTWRYDYSNGGDPRERGALTVMRDPAGVVAVATEYAGSGPWRGRVLAQSAYDDPWTFAYAAAVPQPEPVQVNRNKVALTVTVTDPLGVTVTHSFSATGRKLSTSVPTDAGPPAVTAWVWAANGQLAEIRRPRGDRTLLTWARFGRAWRCTRIALRSGGTSRATTFEFDVGGSLTAVVDAAGARTDLERDATGRLIRLAEPLAPVDGGPDARAVTRYQYDARGRVVRCEQPDGTVIEQTYVAAGPGAGLVHTLAFGGDLATTFGYDAAGRLRTIDGPGGTTAAQEWDDADHIVAEVDPTGLRREYQYDQRSALTEIRCQSPGDAWVSTAVECDAKGRIIRTATPTAMGVATSSIRYDGLDRPVETVGPTGRRTTYRYDPRDLLLEMRDGVGTGTEQRYEWEYEIGGEAVVFTGPAGDEWVSVVDGFGRPTSVTRPDGIVDALTTDVLGRGTELRTFDTAGALVAHERTLFSPTGRITSASSRVLRAGQPPGPWAMTQLGYDAAGRLVRSTGPAGTVTTYTWSPDGLTGAAGPTGESLRFSHDEQGRVVTVEWVTAGPGGPPLLRTSFAHDAVGRLDSATDALGNRWAFDYDAFSRPVTRTGPTGSTTTTRYDELGAPARVETSGAVVAFDNDMTGAPIAVTDPDGVRHTLQRDAFGRVVALTGPDQSTTFTTRYDATGRVASVTTAAGWTAVFTYDVVGNLTRIVSTRAGSSVMENREYTPMGRLSRVVTPEHDSRREWDTLGRCWQETLDGEAVNLDWAPVGPLRRLDLPDGAWVEYERDAAGRVSATTTTLPGGDSLRTAITWWRNDRPGVINVTVEGGETVTRYHYDHGGRLLRSEVTGPAGAIETLTLLPDGRGVPLAWHRDGDERYRLETDALGQLTGVRAAAAGAVPDITAWLAGGAGDQADLDVLATQVGSSGARRWQARLTAGGDRLEVNDGGGATDWVSDAHRYVQVGGEIPVYDAGGRLTSWQNLRFDYDHRDRLIRVSDASGGLLGERSFDGFGRLVSWTNAAGVRRATPVGEEIFAEFTAAAALRYAPGLGTDQAIAVHDGVRWSLLHRDPTWSVLAVSGPDGGVRSRARWGPGGELTALTAAFGPAAAPGPHLRFQGRPDVLEPTAGLIDLRHRVLLAEWGRFTAPDPFGPAGGTNPYLFAGNNPILFVDPTGELFFLAPVLVPVLAGALVGGGLAALTNRDKSGWDFAVAVLAGAAGGGIAAIPGLGVAGLALGGLVAGAVTGGYQGGRQGGGLEGVLIHGGINGAIGAVAGLAGGTVGASLATGVTGGLTSTLTQGIGRGVLSQTSSRLVSQYAGSAAGGAAGGFVGGFTGGTLQSLFSTDFAQASGMQAAQVALAHGWDQGVSGAGWGAVGAVGTKAFMQAGWWYFANPEGGAGLSKVLGAEGEFQAQQQIGAPKATFRTPGGKRPDIWNVMEWFSGRRWFGDAKNTNKIPRLNESNRQLRDMVNTVPNPAAQQNPGGNRFTIFHAPGIKLPGPKSEIGRLVAAGTIELLPLRQGVYGTSSTDDHIK